MNEWVCVSYTQGLEMLGVHVVNKNDGTVSIDSKGRPATHCGNNLGARNDMSTNTLQMTEYASRSSFFFGEKVGGGKVAVQSRRIPMIERVNHQIYW
jgi:hypothetical protein